MVGFRACYEAAFAWTTGASAFVEAGTVVLAASKGTGVLGGPGLANSEEEIDASACVAMLLGSTGPSAVSSLGLPT